MNAPPTLIEEEKLAAASQRRRRRTFRRTMIGFASCVVLLVLVRLWWGVESGRRLQNAIAQIRGRGEPLLVDDFNPTSAIPDDQNAARFYEKASAAFVEATEGPLSLTDLVSEPRHYNDHPDAARAIVQANAEVLRLLHEAAGRAQVDWGVRFKSPVINIPLPVLSSLRELAKFGRSAAWVEFADGDHAAVIETVRDVRRLAERVSETKRAFLISHLVAVTCEAIVLPTLEEFTHTLAVAHEGAATSRKARSQSSASRADVTALIRELLDEESAWRGLRTGVITERALQVDAIRMIIARKLLLAGGPGAGSAFVPLDILLRPMFELDAVFMLRHTSTIVRATAQRSWPAANARLAPASGELARLHNPVLIADMTHWMSRILLPSLDRTFLLQFHMLANRRMAATALAIRLFELGHGRRPAELAELVPDYLAAVPLDPFAADDRALGYKPNGTPPVLYSVSKNGRDDHGRERLTPNGPIGWEHADIVYFLDGNRRRDTPRPPSGTQLSGQAVEDYSEKQVGQGDSDQNKKHADKP